MDRILRRELDAIARDNRSGASELTLRAVTALEKWLQRHPEAKQRALLEIALGILNAQRSMAPLLRLANDVALSAEANQPRIQLRATFRRWRGLLSSASARIARSFQLWLASRPDIVAITYSYSATVAECLIRARGSLHSVFCSEGRPAGEGFEMARRLAASGIKITFCTDGVLTGQMWPGQVLILGADATIPGAFVNKAGTKALVLLAQMHHCPVIVTADTTKFWPEPRLANWTFGSDSEIWDKPPRGVDVYNLYFELTFFSKNSRIMFLTEKGWMTPCRIRQELKKIRISPRLRELVD